MTHFQKLTDSEYEDSFIESISGALNVRITSSLQEEQDSLSNFQIHCDTPKRQSFQRLLKDDGEEIQESLTGDEKSDLFADYSPALENVRYLAGNICQ